jgi:hypothetical protein
MECFQAIGLSLTEQSPFKYVNAHARSSFNRGQDLTCRSIHHKDIEIHISYHFHIHS